MLSLLLALLAVGAAVVHSAAFVPQTASPKPSQAAQKKALEEFNSLIGEWRGVGMPRRGSRRGAWIESAEWVWDFRKDAVAVRYLVNNGKQLQTARLTYDPKTKQYVMAAVFADKTKRTYRGKITGEKLRLVSSPDKAGYTYRITVTRVNDKRTLVLYERKRKQGRQFFRIAEVGYTRKGTSLAVAGADGPECVVTSGRGTMRVSYKGQTYLVCCTGCRQAFEDDPEGVLADYRKRLAERKRGKTSP